MILFWLTLILLTLIACAFIVGPLWRATNNPQDKKQQTENKTWYLEQLNELEQAAAAGKISQEIFAQDKIQLQKDFLALSESENSTQKTQNQRWFAVILACLFVIFTFVLYQKFGSSSLLSEKIRTEQAAAKADAEVKAMGGEQAVIEKLKQQLAQHPDQAQGWYLLGKIYFSQNNFKQAFTSFGKAAKLAPERADIAIPLAEAAYLSQDKQTEKYLQQALKLAPQDPSALNLSALILYHQQKYEQALAIWQNLLMQAPEDSDSAKALQAAIAQAESKLQNGKSAASANKIHLPVTVTLAANLASQVKDNDVLFVYAKAINGPPMPLAIARLSANHFPQKVVLDESMMMSPTLHLQDFAQVMIVARISHSGSAMPQPGDLEGHSAAISTKNPPTMITININHAYAESATQS